MKARLKTEVDLSGLTDKLGNLMGALVGTNQGGRGDIHKFLAVEAAQLARDIGNQIGPKDTGSARAGVEKSLSFVFRSTRKDGVTPITSNLTAEQSESSFSDFTWIYAWSRNGGGVLGVNNEDDQRNTRDVVELKQMLRAGLNHKRGNAYVELGKRGKMHIMRLNRILISKSAWKDLARQIMDKVGQARASFIYTTWKLNQEFGLSINPRIPAFVRKHINSRAGGKAIFDSAALRHPTMPSITFGSTAKGVTSNPLVVDKIARAVERRKHIIVKKMQNVIAGHRFNWNTGQTFRSQVNLGGGE